MKKLYVVDLKSIRYSFFVNKTVRGFKPAQNKISAGWKPEHRYALHFGIKAAK